VTLLQLLIAWLVGKALDQAANKFGPSSPPPPPPRRPPPPRVPDRSRRPTVPSSATVPAATTSTPAWPQVVPTGLPPFPGAGWVLDTPPPPAVVSRANALLQTLWASGPGTFKVEKTAGRWIVYRATPMGEKKGVVAYRESQHSSFLTPPASPASPPIVTPGPVVHASAPSSAPSSVPASSSRTGLPTLRRGSRGSEVAIAQRALSIADDGIFGPGTENAVRAYQRSRGLTPDGVIGPQTWASLLTEKAA
jgi:peptidoglycan hydrolase-like protein with peptidoglycan-binding domain